jgi:hypothetical protein
MAEAEAMEAEAAFTGAEADSTAVGVDFMEVAVDSAAAASEVEVSADIVEAASAAPIVAVADTVAAREPTVAAVSVRTAVEAWLRAAAASAEREVMRRGAGLRMVLAADLARGAAPPRSAAPRTGISTLSARHEAPQPAIVGLAETAA